MKSLKKLFKDEKNETDKKELFKDEKIEQDNTEEEIEHEADETYVRYFTCPSIVDFKVVDENLTEVTFKDNYQELVDLEDELIKLKLKSKSQQHFEGDEIEEDFDIVEEFIGPELKEFYEEYERMEEDMKKNKIKKAVASFVVKTWKENLTKNKVDL